MLSEPYLLSIYIYAIQLAIPTEYAVAWNFIEQDEVWVNVTYDTAEQRHSNCFAPEAQETDNGRRLGIKISTIVNGGGEILLEATPFTIHPVCMRMQFFFGSQDRSKMLRTLNG